MSIEEPLDRQRELFESLANQGALGRGKTPPSTAAGPKPRAHGCQELDDCLCEANISRLRSLSGCGAARIWIFAPMSDHGCCLSGSRRHAKDFRPRQVWLAY